MHLRPPKIHASRTSEEPTILTSAIAGPSTLRILALGLGTLTAIGGCAPGGEPEAFPSRAIEIVSWATPGGPSDLLARALAESAPQHFAGQDVRVVTRQGGAGAAGMQYLQNREGDPHILAIFTASGTVNMATGRIPFRTIDFTPILRIQMDPFLIAVRSDSPFDDLDDLFSMASERPGEVSLSGFGAASAHFLGFHRLRDVAGGPDIRWIAYAGSADAAVAALGGHTDAVHTNFNIVREHVAAGNMKVLGAAQSIPALPDVLTYAEQGYDLAPVHWRGVVGPPGLSSEVRDDLRARLLAAIDEPTFHTYMERASMERAVMEDAGTFATWMSDEVVQSREVLLALGLVEDEAGTP